MIINAEKWQKALEEVLHYKIETTKSSTHHHLGYLLFLDEHNELWWVRGFFAIKSKKKRFTVYKLHGLLPI